MQYGQLKYMQEEGSVFTCFPKGCSVGSAGHRTCSSCSVTRLIMAGSQLTACKLYLFMVNQQVTCKTERSIRLKSLYDQNASRVFSSSFFKVSEVFSIIFLLNLLPPIDWLFFMPYLFFCGLSN